MAEIIKITDEGLTGYYLYEKFQGEEKESGLKFITTENEDGDEETAVEFHYKDQKDLQKKLSFILMLLTDK